MAKIALIIAPKGFQEIEYGEPKTILEREGHEVITASTVQQPIGHMGNPVTADTQLEEINTEEYNAIAFIGGPGSPFYFTHPKALELAKQFAEAGKITAAICAGPSILANAAVLEGKNATCFPSEIKNLADHGAITSDTPVVQDGNIITANGPAAAKEFGKTIAKSLK